MEGLHTLKWLCDTCKNLQVIFCFLTWSCIKHYCWGTSTDADDLRQGWVTARLEARACLGRPL